jgi:hypothetical protein
MPSDNEVSIIAVLRYAISGTDVLFCEGTAYLGRMRLANSPGSALWPRLLLSSGTMCCAATR